MTNEKTKVVNFIERRIKKNEIDLDKTVPGSFEYVKIRKFLDRLHKAGDIILGYEDMKYEDT